MFKWIALALLVLPVFAHAGMEEGVAAYASGDYATAMKEFKELADKGDVPATYYVGFLYRQGYGVPIDQAELRTFRCEGLRNGLADTGRRAGHDDCLAAKPHDPLSSCRRYPPTDRASQRDARRRASLRRPARDLHTCLHRPASISL